MADMELFEAMYSARSIRRLKKDPVPDKLITKVLDAAIRAPSGGNTQNWLFAVIKDAEQRRKIGDIYRRGGEVILQLYGVRERPAHMTKERQERMMAGARYLFEHMHEAPVLILACLKLVPSGPLPPSLPSDVRARIATLDHIKGSNIYPAVQNIILACRALGLGTVLTTVHTYFEDEVKAALDLPKDVQTYALLPIGFPDEKFAPVKRVPVNQVAFLDRYGKAWTG